MLYRKNKHIEFAKERFTFFIQTDNMNVVTVRMRDKVTHKCYFGQHVFSGEDFDIQKGVSSAVECALSAYNNADPLEDDETTCVDSENSYDSIHVGDKVKIVDRCGNYFLYSSWVRENAPDNKFWVSGRRCYHYLDLSYTVDVIAPADKGYSENSEEFALISNEDRGVSFVMSLSSIEKI